MIVAHFFCCILYWQFREAIMSKQKTNKLWQLFSTTFLISASTSGGYAIISMMKDVFVNKRKWIDEQEMVDLISIAQSTPGPLAINASVLVGYRVSGTIGALITMAGATLPPLVIMSIVANCYQLIADNMFIRNLMRGMSSAVAALLVSVTIDLFINLSKEHSLLSYILMLVCFVIAKFTNISYFYIALFCGIAGVIKALILKKKASEQL